MFFAVHHVGMLAGLIGVAAVAWRRSSLVMRAGFVVASLGILALTACEVAAIGAADALTEFAQADTLNTGYGPAR